MKWKFLVPVTALLATLALPSCSTALSTESGTISTRVIVTRDFGHELLLDKTLEIPAGSSAMTALQKSAEVETAYGGGFVEAINGIRSGFTGGSKTDWFVYINGMEANAGALDYKLHDGDVQHWDFREWGFHQFVPAIIGDFPEPLRHGYGGVTYPTIIVYQDGLAQDAKRIVDYLKGLSITNLSAKATSELQDNEKESANLILLGTYDLPLIAELNKAWSRLGFYAYFQDNTVKVVDASGKPAAEYNTATGLIQATQSPWNPNGTGACQNTVWIISGTDSTGIKAAINALVNHAPDFECANALVITGEKVIRIP